MSRSDFTRLSCMMCSLGCGAWTVPPQFTALIPDSRGELDCLAVCSPANSLRHGHQLENVAIGIREVDAAPAVPVVELCVIERPRGAAEREPGGLHPLQDRVEFRVADVKRIMMALDCFNL